MSLLERGTCQNFKCLYLSFECVKMVHIISRVTSSIDCINSICITKSVIFCLFLVVFRGLDMLLNTRNPHGGLFAENYEALTSFGPSFWQMFTLLYRHLIWLSCCFKKVRFLVLLSSSVPLCCCFTREFVFKDFNIICCIQGYLFHKWWAKPILGELPSILHG